MNINRNSIISSQQKAFFKKTALVYGGEFYKKRAGRVCGRSVTTRESMHFTLRSTQAKGAWSFRRHKTKIASILAKFAKKNGVILLSFANVGNHIHIHLRLTNRHTYRPFIRAVTSAIMMATTGVSRWSKHRVKNFWDLRPFSRVIRGFKAFLTLKDYIRINQYEGEGYSRSQAHFIVKFDWRVGEFR